MTITLFTLVDEYYLSHDFKELRDATKVHYRYHISAVLATDIDGVVIGEVDCNLSWPMTSGVIVVLLLRITLWQQLE